MGFRGQSKSAQHASFQNGGNCAYCAEAHLIAECRDTKATQGQLVTSGTSHVLPQQALSAKPTQQCISWDTPPAPLQNCFFVVIILKITSQLVFSSLCSTLLMGLFQAVVVQSKGFTERI